MDNALILFVLTKKRQERPLPICNMARISWGDHQTYS